MQNASNTHSFFLAYLLILIALFCVYTTGLSGPFMFDDGENIENNRQLRLTELSVESIVECASSGNAGPLKRPVAMLSFALNYYFSGNELPFSFKATNVVIQSICAWLAYILCHQLLTLTHKKPYNRFQPTSFKYIAFAIAILWAVHPIGLTSVLYIVQRMTSLSTLFTLACLILYIKGRTPSLTHNLYTKSLLLLSSFVCFLLAIFSKENALLIPIYIILLEWMFFSSNQPYAHLKTYSKHTKKLLWGLVFIGAGLTCLYALNYAANGYAHRHFTITERTLTEARVVSFYLSLIIIPRINAFGLFHDDIPISTSIVDPWTTTVSIIFIIGLIFTAIRLKKTNPLFTFGILFFFAGHLMESTVFALEIAHEHRNHLPSIGIIIAISSLLINSKLKTNWLVSIVVLSLIVLGSSTALRSSQWSDEYSLALYESNHHPSSPATLGLLSTNAFINKDYNVALESINKAKDLAPYESAYAINALVLNTILGKPIDLELEKEIRLKLQQNPFSASSQLAIAQISEHITAKSHAPLLPHYVKWLEIIVNKMGKSHKAAINHYFLAKAQLINGNILGAINSHQNAYHLDNRFINPLFEIGNIFLSLKQADNARIVLQQIEKANKNPKLDEDYSKHIQELQNAISTIDNKMVN